MPESLSPESDQHDDFNKPGPTGGNESGNGNHRSATNGTSNNESVPRPKRIACILCRKRKLKCDGNKPSCGTCSRLGHHCEYTEERKKSGPKRGYVKLLEARLKQVENMLETHNVNDSTSSNPTSNTDPDKVMMPVEALPNFEDASVNDPFVDHVFETVALNSMPGFDPGSDTYSWEMIGLGLEEALPTQDAIDELNQIYFEKIHPSLPMLHRARFLATMDYAPHMRPPVCLRYAMWTQACSVSAKYSAYTENFYIRARKYAEQDEMRGHGESMITLAHAQCWTLIACYEFKLMYFPRAWMSVGRATRLAQMMGLHRLDRVGLDVKQTLAPPRDWIEREERRRTFWMAYCQDRYASVGTGWPMTIDEQDILTNLPASDEAFNTGQPEATPQLSDVLSGDGASALSSFGGVCLLASMYGRNLTHLHRPNPRDNDHDLNGEFWKRHRTLDNILLNISLSMPASLRLPAGINDPNTVFLNMNIHTATICLHQAAIFKADNHRLPAQISAESKRRCIVGADQITNNMKMISHLDLSVMNPFMAFSLYIAARVFVQYLKSRRDDSTVKSSLHFLLAAMQVLKVKNPLTESFLVQLDVDLEGSGLDINRHTRQRFPTYHAGENPLQTDAVKCSPLFEIRQSQNIGAVNPVGTVHSQSQSQSPQQPLNNSFESANQSSFYFNMEQQTPQIQVNNCAKVTPMEHLVNSSMDGVDYFYNQLPEQQQTNGTSPNFMKNTTTSNSGGFSSNQQTPSSNSNQDSSSYSNISPPPQPQSSEPFFKPPFVNTQSTSAVNNPAATETSPLPISQVPCQNLTSDHYETNTSWTTVPLHQQHPVHAAVNMSGYEVNNSHDSMDMNLNMNMNMNMTNNNHNNNGPSTGMTPGATGMTPLPDSLWQGVTDQNDWMF